MKHNVLMLVLMAVCSLAAHTLYAGKVDALGRAGYVAYKTSKSGLFTKCCPDCGGTGTDGWWECENCDGSGRVCNWVTIIIAGVLVLGALNECLRSKKN